MSHHETNKECIVAVGKRSFWCGYVAGFVTCLVAAVVWVLLSDTVHQEPQHVVIDINAPKEIPVNFHAEPITFSGSIHENIEVESKQAKPAPHTCHYGPDVTLLDFRADWCGPCRSMDPVVEQLKTSGFSVQQVNVDSNKALASQYGVSEIPCFVAISDGKEIGREVGVTSSQSLMRMLTTSASIPKLKTSHEPNWWKWAPRLAAGNYGTVLTDLEAHGGPNNATYRDASDATSWGHELTHYVNSLIRNSLGDNGINGFYVLNDRCMVLHEPHFTLSDVARRVTNRGPSFGLYLGSQLGDWNAHPTYILDEMIAYSNGALAGSYTGSDQWQYQRKCAAEMSSYAKVLIQTVKQLDPNYQDLPQLIAFVDWNDQRLKGMGQ